VTTHNNNQSDVDASVVELAVAPNTIGDSSASLTIPDDTTPALPSSEQASLIEPVEAGSSAFPVSQTEELTASTLVDVPDVDASTSVDLASAPIENLESFSPLVDQNVASPEEASSAEQVEPSIAASEPVVSASFATNDEPSPLSSQVTSAPSSVVEAILSTTQADNAATEPQPLAESPSVDEVTEQTNVVDVAVDKEAEAPLPLATLEEQEVVSAEPSFPYASILSFGEPRSEEVRSFSDFIEEFRQSEASLETHVDFSLLTPSTPTLEEAVEAFAPVPPVTQPTLSFLAEEQGVANEAISKEQPSGTQISESDVTPEERGEMPAKSELTLPTPITRVSPLLRPASRLRMPRHTTRHHRDEPVQETPQNVAPSEATTPEAPIVSLPEPVQPQPVEQTIEPPVEQPRPARRYRFDRPSAASNITTNTRSTGPTQSGIASTSPVQKNEEMREKETTQNRGIAPQAGSRQEAVRQETVVPQSEPASPPPTKATHGGNGHIPQEQPAPKQAVAQEQTSSENTIMSIGTTEPNENGRRRHHQERQQKEQPVVNSTPTILPQPAAEIVVPADIIPLEPVSPEDLPPLEYAELQKANPRRRRRHRNSPPSNGVAIPQSTPEAPATQAPLPPVAPAPVPVLPLPEPDELPAARGSLVNPFSIVSGYTVSQMNQGNEVTGPFMGPEPSPARGSVVNRDGRTTRAEMQRTPAYPPAVRTTTHEGGISSSSLNHLANVVSQSIQQSIQLQTDRMVTEMRRNSQAPTSVSVTLPPFPSTERVGVFVDVANLLYSARTLRIAVDFGKLLDFLRGNRRLIRAHAYCPTSPQAGDEQMFLQAVKGLGYRITTKNYKTFSSGAKKADLDLDLCMDVVRIVDGRAVDCIVLVSGDSDFMPMLDYCSDHGVRVEVAAFDEAMSATLRQSCDLFVNLSMLEEIRS
jgi:uncharacterized LabA/DUF88 family protein